VHDVIGQHRFQSGDVPGGRRGEEPVGQPLPAGLVRGLIRAGHGGDRGGRLSGRPEPPGGAPPQLPARGLGLAEYLGDLLVPVAERLVQDQHRPLRGGQPLAQHEEGHGDGLALFGCLEGAERPVAGACQHGLGEPGTYVALAPLPGRGQERQAEVGHGGGEPGGRLADGGAVRGGPAQEGVLQDVLSVGRGPQQPVGEPEQAPAFGLEDHGGIACHLAQHSRRAGGTQAVIFRTVPMRKTRAAARRSRSRAPLTGRK